jgi:alpha-mannosidase
LRIDCDVTFRFDEDTFIGDPWDIKPEDRSKERRRSSNDGRPKLQAIFPARLSGGVIDKSSAFEVCRSRNASTHFQRWDEIKHNIITNWVDLFDEGQGTGLAILSDRTTAYSHGEGEPLGLILGWGGEAGYWWGKCPLRGDQQAQYALLPHRGSWAEAGLWQENQAFEEAVIAQEMPTAPSSNRLAALLHIRTPHTTLSSVMMVDGEVQIRLFCPSPQVENAILEVGFPVQSARLIELDGRPIHPLRLMSSTAGRITIHVEMPAFAIRTLRLTPALPVQASKDHG